MKTVFEAAQPRSDVLSGELRDDIFAAKLEDVTQGTAEPVYQDPDVFFANTEPTSGLTTLLKDALGRATGGKPAAPPVIRLETAFGGGKTHSLIALYHLARGARPADVDAYVDPALLPKEPLRIVALVGTSLDPRVGLDHGDVTTRTLWGELAYQLGTYEELREADEGLSAVSVPTIEKVFGSQPAIVMVDELARYLEVADSVKAEGSTLAKQTAAFLMALFAFAGSSPNVVIVYTLASSSDAFADQTEVITALTDTKAVSARSEHVITPTTEKEIAKIVRKRLFETVDLGEAPVVAQAYHDALLAELDKSSDLPASAGTAGYAEDIETDYPFHPELLRVLNEKVSTIPNFQRTRGALRLLARTIRVLWGERPTDAFLIHPHHVNLADEDTVNDVTSRLDRPLFRQVVEADIVNPMAGAKAHAATVDQQLIAAGKPPYATRVATTVFLHSLVQGAAAGTTPAEVKAAVYSPGDDLGLLERQLDAMLDHAWFMDLAANRLRFSTEPSLVKVVNDEMNLVGKSSAKGEIDRRIRRIWQRGVFDPVFFPAEPSEVDDTFDRPKLAVMHYDAAAVAGDQAAPPDLVIHIFDKAGTSQKQRLYRNNLVFLVADENADEHAVEESRRYLAVNRIVGDLARLSDFAKENQQRLRKMAEEAELTLRVAITRMYQAMYYPDASAPEKHGRLSRFLLPAQDQGEVERDQTEIVLRSLKDLDKVLTADDPDIPPKYIREKAWPGNAERVTPLQIRKEYAMRISLKILLDVNKLKETIKLGVRSGQWLYMDAGKGCAYSNESTTTPLVEISDDAELILAEAAAGIPICDKPGVEAGEEEKCPVCGRPKSQCICSAPPPPPGKVLAAEGAPGQVFQGIVDQAQDKGVAELASLTLKVAGSGQDFVRDLIAMALAVPQLPKSKVMVAMTGAFTLKDAAQLRIEFRGAWERYRPIHDIVQRSREDVADAEGRIEIELSFTDGLVVAGPDLSSMKDIFVQLKPGAMSVSGVPKDAGR